MTDSERLDKVIALLEAICKATPGARLPRARPALTPDEVREWGRLNRDAVDRSPRPPHAGDLPPAGGHASPEEIFGRRDDGSV